MNYWVLALYYEWATTDMVKQALAYEDCSIQDLAEGVNKKLITADQYKEITEKPCKAFLFCLFLDQRRMKMVKYQYEFPLDKAGKAYAVKPYRGGK